MAPVNQTFGELLSHGVKYIIPRFQRDYAWDQEQWEDLWEDIKTLKDSHYMGYIVLQKKGGHEFEVIDGQQRLTTLTLIILAIMRKLQDLIKHGVAEQANKERLDVFTNRFIGLKNAVTLIVENKLSLNRNNHRHFRKISSNLKIVKELRLSNTNLLLNNAFDFFVKKIKSKDGSELARFAEKLADQLFFTKIITQDNIDAYKIFETFNARGVQLSTSDLLKNHIFAAITNHDDVTDGQLDQFDEDWAVIIAQLGEYNFSNFISCHYNIQKKTVSQRLLFKSIKEIVKSPASASEYLKSLGNYAPVYAALLMPHDVWWHSYEHATKITHYLEGLKLFQIKQPFPVLMVAWERFTNQEFVLALKYLYILSVRYNIICRFSPGEQEKVYNKIAVKIFNGEFTCGSHIKNSEEFKQLYPDDNAFKNAFAFYKLPGRGYFKKIRFLLSEIENNFGRKLNYLDTNLEHVCPYNPNQSWYEEFGEGIHDIIDRLGNMVLLEKNDLKRADFSTKKQAYLMTSLKLANQVSKYDTWDLAALNHYQAWLAEQAAKTWKVS